MGLGVLVVTNFNIFSKKYSKEEYSLLLSSIQSFINKLSSRSDVESVEILDLAGYNYNDWKGYKALFSKVIGSNIGTVVIIGNDDVVPFCRLINIIDGETIYSDSYYLDFQENGDHYTRIAIGRIPDGNKDIDILLNALATYSKSSPVDVTSRRCISSETWHQISKMVYKRVDPTLQSLLTSSPYGVKMDSNVRLSLIHEHFPDDGIIYFNLHGEQDLSIWFGEKRKSSMGHWLSKSCFTECLNVAFVEGCSFNNTVVLSSACHTTAIAGKDRKNNIAMALLAKGCLGVVGPSSTAYSFLIKRGMPAGITGIDLLCQNFVINLLEGKVLGESLRLAKSYYIPSDECDDVNVLGLNLLGNPFAKISVSNEYG